MAGQNQKRMHSSETKDTRNPARITVDRYENLSELHVDKDRWSLSSFCLNLITINDHLHITLSAVFLASKG